MVESKYFGHKYLLVLECHKIFYWFTWISYTYHIRHKEIILKVDFGKQFGNWSVHILSATIWQFHGLSQTWWNTEPLFGLFYSSLPLYFTISDIVHEINCMHFRWVSRHLEPLHAAAAAISLCLLFRGFVQNVNETNLNITHHWERNQKK
jgi:hypothetical protein